MQDSVLVEFNIHRQRCGSVNRRWMGTEGVSTEGKEERKAYIALHDAMSLCACIN